ncbi:hypothetical protein YB2330_001468 [Saitoella coloradoensis]
MLPITLSTALLALLPILAPIVHARTDLEGCVSSQTVAYGGASLIWYVPGTGEICSFLDCGGGRAPPKTTVPGCAAYVGTGTYEPSYLPGYAATGVAQATSTSMPMETEVQGVVTPSVDASTVTAAPEVIPSTSTETTESTPMTKTSIADLSSSTFFAPGVAETGSSSAAIESSTASSSSSSLTSSAFTSTTTSSSGATSVLPAAVSSASASASVSGARSSARSSSGSTASAVASSTGATQNSDAQRMAVGGLVGVLGLVGMMMML